MTAKRLVLIEDNRSDANLIEEMLGETGLEHELIWLHDGEEAIKFFKDGGRADLILLDLNVPRFNGHEVMRFLNEEGLCQGTPVVIMTGSTSPTDQAKAREEGAIFYLVKPMTMEEIDRTVGSLKKIMLDLPNSSC